MTATGVGTFLGVGKNLGADLRQAKVARDRFIDAYKLNLEADLKKVPLETTRRRTPDDLALDEVDVKLSAELEGTTEGAASYLATSVLGVTPTSVQDGVDVSYLHTWAGMGDLTPNVARLSVEKRLGTLANSWLANVVVNRLGLRFNQEGYCRWNVEAPGSKFDRLTTPTVATRPATTTLLSRRQCTLTLDGVTTLPVTGGMWEIEAGRKLDDYDVTSRDRRDADYDGPSTAKFELDVLVPDDGFLRRYLGGSAVTAPADVEGFYGVNIKVERPDVFTTTRKHMVTLDLPRVSLTDPKTINVDAGKSLTQRITGRAFFNSATSRELTLSLRNSLSSA